jgi:predicted nucleotidyltransferase
MTVTIQQAAARIRAAYHPAQILLVGSWARGDATEGSDIDLVVLFDHPVDWRMAGQIRSVLRGLPASFDVFTTSRDAWESGTRDAVSFEYALSADAVVLDAAA